MNAWIPPDRIFGSGKAKFLLKVETSSEPESYARFERLRNAVWDFPEDHLAGTRNLMCESFLHDGSSLFLAAYAETPAGGFDESEAGLVGFSYGFVGIRDKVVAFRSLDNLWFYSQYTGVRPDAEGHGLGVAIKEFQRDVLRDIYGIFTVVCTYDPLTAVNAHRNIRRFGMSVLEYRAATYGDYGGRLNRLDVPTDRFFMSWDLKKDRTRPEPAGPARGDAEIPSVLATTRRIVAGKTRSLELEIAGGLDLVRAAGSVRVPVPEDFYGMLGETDVADPGVRSIPVDWRMKTREAFQELFARGFRVVDFRPESLPHAGPHYLLERG